MRYKHTLHAVQDGVAETEGPFVERVSDITVHQVMDGDRIVYRKDRVAQRDCTMGSTYDWDAIERMNARDRGETPMPAENPELTDDADDIVFVPIIQKRKPKKPVYFCLKCGREITMARSHRFCSESCQREAYAEKANAKKREETAKRNLEAILTPPPELICDGCGSVFKGKVGSFKGPQPSYCSKRCAASAANRRKKLKRLGII